MPKALPKKVVDLLVVGVASPLLVGVYEEGRLIESYESNEKASAALPPFLHHVRYDYKVRGLYYAKGPGSYMGIKVTYVMLKTLSIALEIPLMGVDAFAFNGNHPIKAVGRSCFVKKGKSIVIEKACQEIKGIFTLPKRLDRNIFEADAEPLYVLPAV